MIKRIFIHVQNLSISIKWLYCNYRAFQKDLEDRGFYALEFYKIWLWKKNAKYFRAYNTKGDYFFIKLKTRDSIEFESKALNYISERDAENNNFYPRIVATRTGDFNYIISENILGHKIKKKSLRINLLNQMKEILIFLKDNKIIHRDIRPHNIIINDGKIILLDFEHCIINGAGNIDDAGLNSSYSPDIGIWDDAFSFKKIIESYCSENFKNDKNYIYICDMVKGYRHA